MNYKRLFLVIGFILVCLGLLFLMYLVFFKPAPPQPGDPDYIPPGAVNLPEVGTGGDITKLGPGGQLPGTGNVPGAGETETPAYEKAPDDKAMGRETYALPLSSGAVVGSALSSGKNGVSYYETDSQKFYKISADGKTKLPLSDEAFYGVQGVTWSPDGTKAIMEYPDGMKLFYDFATKKKATLPKEVTDPEFSQNGEKIAFKYETGNPDNNYLVVAKPDGSEAKLIEHVGNEGSRVEVAISPKQEIIAFYASPTSLGTSEVFLIGQQGENFKSVEITGTNFESTWSPKGSYLIYSTVSADSGYQPILWAVATNGSSFGQQKKNLGLFTWTNKCVFFDEQNVYCAVPQSLPEGAGLYPGEMNGQGDDLYLINLATGSKRKVAEAIDPQTGQTLIAGSLSVAADESNLFVWDIMSRKVYAVRLK